MKPAVALLFACDGIWAQPVTVAPAFDVASVKRLPADAPRRGSVHRVTPVGIDFHGTLGNFIQWAWGYQNWEVIGPTWRDYPTDVIYDIAAKTASPVPESQLKLMLQTLLKERLGLAYHLGTRDLPVYALVVARNGPKLLPYFLDQPPPAPGRAIDLEGAYIWALPAQLGLRLEPKTAPLEVMVIDHVEKDPTAN